MKYFLILIVVVFSFQDASAQKPWKWTRLKGPNVGNLVQKLLWGANGEIIALSSTGYYVSTDEGNNWDFRSVFKRNSAIAYAPNIGMLITSDGIYYFYASQNITASDSDIVGIYASTDNGNSWNHLIKKISVTQIIEGTDHSLYFTSITIESKYHVFESIDKGKSWVEVPKLIDGVFNGSTTLLGSNSKYVFTIDYSNSNYPYKFSNDNQTLVSFVDGLGLYNLRGFAMIDSILFAFNDSCLYSTYGEQSWVNLCSLKGIHSITKGGNNTILAEASRSYTGITSIYSSSNWGKSWDSIAVIPIVHSGINRTSLNYSDINRIIYQDSRGLYISKDRGNSWVEIGFPYANINSILVTDENRIFVTQTYDSTKMSSDNGISWHNINTEQYSFIVQMIQGPERNIIAVSGTTTTSIWIFDTIQSQWIKKSILGYASSSNLFMTSDRTKYVYLSSGASIFRSDDNGFSWLDINAPFTGNPINSLEANPEGTIYFGAVPVMYRSDDHGITWTKLLPVHDIVGLTHIKTFGVTGVLLGTEGDGLLLSNDKGNSWTRIDGNNFDTVTCIAVDSKGGIAAGTNHGLWMYDPIKTTWTKVTLGHDDNLYIGGLDVAKNDDFYVGTYGSSVWIGTRNYNSVKYSPSDHTSMKISPNPTNGKITVTFDAANNEQLRLELYDILGRKISVLANGKYSGENEISFNTSDLSNGIYSLILSGALNESQKIVVQH